MDQDGDGKVDYQEFITAAADKAALIKDDYLKAAFSIFDKDNDGTISLKELKSGFGANKDEDDEQWLIMLK
jgi:calcium-dependent protein kinase